MKTASLLLFIILFPLCFSSCSKDDEGNAPGDLAKTAWVSDDERYSLIFISATSAMLVWDGPDIYFEEENCMYTVNGENIIFDFGEGDIMAAKFEGNSITANRSNEVFTVKKQSPSANETSLLKNLTGTTWVSDDEQKGILFTTTASAKFFNPFWEGSEGEIYSYTVIENYFLFNPGGGDVMTAKLKGNSITVNYVSGIYVVEKQ